MGPPHGAMGPPHGATKLNFTDPFLKPPSNLYGVQAVMVFFMLLVPCIVMEAPRHAYREQIGPVRWVFWRASCVSLTGFQGGSRGHLGTGLLRHLYLVQEDLVPGPEPDQPHHIW
jgi:hypothetical protein